MSSSSHQQQSRKLDPSYFAILKLVYNSMVSGLSDSLSFDRAIPVLVNSSPVRASTGKCLAANGGLLVGSILMFEYGIKPVLSMLSAYFELTTEERIYISYMNHAVFCFYHGMWVVPVWLLCYCCSSMWYQEIADDTYRYSRGTPKVESNSKNKIAAMFYSTLVFLCVYFEYLLFVTVLPSFINKFLGLLNTGGALGFVIRTPFFIFSWIVYLFGTLFAGVLYGWYGFDFYWISDGWDPHDRYRAVEKNWAYLFGFGLPYVLLVRSSGFFLGYGLYLLLFPFCIILSTFSEIDSVVKKSDNELAPRVTESILFPIPWFEIPQMITQALLGAIDSRWIKQGIASSMRKTKFK